MRTILTTMATAACLLGVTATAADSAKQRPPAVVKATYEVTYRYSADYSFELKAKQPEFCDGDGGSYQSRPRLVLKTTLTIPLDSNDTVAKSKRFAALPGGTWSTTLRGRGVMFDDCTTPARTLECAGEWVLPQDRSTPGGTLTALSTGRDDKVRFSIGVSTTYAEDTDGCDDRQIRAGAPPALATSLVSRYRAGTTSVSVATLGRIAKGKSITRRSTPAGPREPDADFTTCGGRDDCVGVRTKVTNTIRIKRVR